MAYLKQDFIPFSSDAGRVVANLEAVYGQLIDALSERDALPVSMFWQTKSGVDYLTVKQRSADSGTTFGPRSPEAEKRLLEFQATKSALRTRIDALNQLLTQRAQQWRAMRLPFVLDRQGEILRELDRRGLLRNDLLVVGTNAFAAYELACNARFPVGNEETEDFDLAWCRGTSVSMALITPTQTGVDHLTLIAALKGIDSTYRINPKKPYQAVNDDGYEVELLAAPSTHPLPRHEQFSPMASLVEQEWLIRGSPVSCVVATQRNRACPLYVPDPRWMAVHKLWLSRKPGRNPSKQAKDARQGNVLLDATRYFLRHSHPLDIDFVMGLPKELRSVFDEWASSRRFDPGQLD